MGDMPSGFASVKDNHSNKPRIAASDRSSERKDVLQTDFLNLPDRRLVELIEDPINPRRTLLAVWANGGVQYVDEFEHDGQLFVPLQRNEVLNGVHLPRAVCPPGSLQKLIQGIEDLISQCVSLQAKYIPVLTAFVLSTWFIDRFTVAPYLSVVGLPQSGKTTLLQVLKLLCRRSWLIGDITAASLYRACTQFSPTILIDEAATVINNGRLRHMLRTGATKEVISVQGNCSFHAYGAKVISWIEPPDDAALNSRCIVIPMFETRRTDLCKINDPQVVLTAASLQAQLLYYRLENYNKVEPSPMKDEVELRPRTRDLLRVLSAAIVQDPERSRSLTLFFKSGNAVPLEPLSPEQNAVLLTLFALIHAKENVGALRTSDLTRNVNHCLRVSGEKRNLQPRKVGAVLTSLGFCNRTRGNAGWCVNFDQGDMKKIHQLAENYGIDRASQSLMKSLFGTGHTFAMEKCSLCQAAVKKETRFVPPIGEHAPVELGSRK